MKNLISGPAFFGMHHPIYQNLFLSKFPRLEELLSKDYLKDRIQPNYNTMTKWFSQKMPLRDVRAIFLVRDFLSPREFHVNKAISIFNGSPLDTEEEKEDFLKERGIFILPYQFFEKVDHAPGITIDLDEQIVQVNNYLLTCIISQMITLNPRNITPVLVIEPDITSRSPYIVEGLISAYNRDGECLFGEVPNFYNPFDFGVYIRNDIPAEDMPVMINVFYIMESSKNISHFELNKYILQLYKKR